ncbi:MAG: aminotransferase class I/II-fold pyridoxal phosphate-dependent enzyme [bacterium]
MKKNKKIDIGIFKRSKILIDKGFNTEFKWYNIKELCTVFSDDENIRSYIYKLRNAEGSIDIKRGELYPELLRALFSLQKLVSSMFKIEPIQVQPNFGSNGSIDTILTAVKLQEKQAVSLLPKGKNGKGVLFAVPTYFRNYNSASARLLTIHKVPLLNNFEFDVKSFISEMKLKRPGIIILVTPNNPSGLPIHDQDILLVLDNLPKGTWAMIDRTLVNTRPEISTYKLLHRYANKNIVILHSFSKYQGMSHLRIGLALYSNPVMAGIVRPLLPLGMSLEGTIKAYNIIKENRGLFPSLQIIRDIKSNSKILKKFVEKNPEYYITDFSSNYCLMGLPKHLDSQDICEILSQQGLFVMGGHDFPEPNNRFVRLHTGGNPQYIDRMCNVLTDTDTVRR